MMNPRTMLAAAATCAVLMLTAGSCGDDTFDPDYQECGPGCIGPGGGTVAITDPDHPLYGVKVTVPPGAWDRAWTVFLGYESTFTTPNFPDGLEGYRGILTGSLNIELGRFPYTGEPLTPPDSLYMEITFPRRDLVDGTGQIITAYHYDEAVQRWRLKMPAASTDSTITVKTHLHGELWTWGIVTIAEADWDLYLAPLLAELHGDDAWNELQLELQRTYDSLVQNDLGISCNSLNLIRDLFGAVRDDAAVRITAHQDGLGGICRDCDATTTTFLVEYLEYISLNLEAFFIRLMFVENGPTLLIQAYGFMRLCETLAEIDELACDYSCFWQHADMDFYSDLALYYTGCMVVAAVNYAMSSGYIDCPT